MNTNNNAFRDNVIWWVRHGESISNLYENNCEDLYPEELRNEFQNMRVKIKKEEQTNYMKTYYSQIIKAIESLKSKKNTLEEQSNKENKKNIEDLTKMIETWTNMINNNNNNNNNNKWSELKGMVDVMVDVVKGDTIEKKLEQKTEQTSIKPPASWLFTPTLTYIGIKQSILAGTNLFNKLQESNKYKEPLFITSATVRTIMTAIYAFYSYKNNCENKGKTFDGKIYVVPYINEHLNGAGCCGEPNLDNSNSAIPYDILDKVIEYIARFVITHEDYNYKKMTGVSNNSNKNEFMQKSSKETEITNLKALIDTSLYTRAYTNDPSNYNKSNINHFIAQIYPDDKLNKNNQIIAFTHGNFINRELRKNAELTIEGTEEYNKMKNTKAKQKYDNENKSKNNQKLLARKKLNNATTSEITKFEIFNIKEHTFPNNCSVWPTLINADNTIKYAVKVDEKFNGFIEGGGIRISRDVFDEEKKSFNINSETGLDQSLNPSFCSLAKGSLRGDINISWLDHTSPAVNVSSISLMFKGGNNKKKTEIRKTRKYKSNKKSLTKKK